MFITTNNTNHDHDTRNRDARFPPAPRTTSALHTLRHHTPKFLTTIPTNIREKIDTHSLKGFANYSKNFYISEYDTECTIVDCYICKL